MLIDGTTLEEKHLGVLIDDELKFHKHVSTAISNAKQTLSIMKRTFDALDKELLPIVYKHQVRPHLEYGNTIWHPHYIADMEKVEGVRCRATEVIMELSDKHYQERLQLQIEHGQERGYMIQAYKILKKIDRIDPTTFFTQTKYKGIWNHRMKLFKPRFKSELTKHAFSQGIIDDWNSLTENIVNSESLDIFKGRLDKLWRTE